MRPILIPAIIFTLLTAILLSCNRQNVPTGTYSCKLRGVYINYTFHPRGVYSLTTLGNTYYGIYFRRGKCVYINNGRLKIKRKSLYDKKYKLLFKKIDYAIKSRT